MRRAAGARELLDGSVPPTDLAVTLGDIDRDPADDRPTRACPQRKLVDQELANGSVRPRR